MDEQAKDFDEEALKARVTRNAAKVTEDDAWGVVARERELNEKFKHVPEKLKKVVNQVKLLYELIRSYIDGSYREVPWMSIATAVAAVVYFLAPIDLIPDVIPGIGYIDDIFVIRFALNALGSDLKTFCEWKGYDLTKYFD
ncbi:MAG TPA: YkvA family protein [Polyangiales bacterium]|nr:YkvA family protein [Polyangiales bacterium]